MNGVRKLAAHLGLWGASATLCLLRRVVALVADSMFSDGIEVCPDCASEDIRLVPPAAAKPLECRNCGKRFEEPLRAAS